MKMYKYFLLLAFCLITACTSEEDNTASTDDDDSSLTFDRSTMLVHWADNIILPSYSNFLIDFATLESQFNTFQNEINEVNLTNLRQAWIEAYKSWQRISMFEIGPAEEDGLRLNINTFPTDVALVESHVTSGVYDFNLPSNRDAKGFPAIDYLLNGLADNDTAVVAIYAGGNGANYLSYFEDVLVDIKARVTAVNNAWQNGYRTTFVENNGSSATASVDRFVNDFIFYYEKFLRAGKMGIPLGVFTGVQVPNTLESFYYPELSKDLFLEGLDAVENFFKGVPFESGTAGESLSSYLAALNQEPLSEDILNQFSSARSAVEQLQPFRTEIENNNPAVTMLSAYDEVQKAVALLKVDMVSAMNIAIDFVDADGD